MLANWDGFVRKYGDRACGAKGWFFVSLAGLMSGVGCKDDAAQQSWDVTFADQSLSTRNADIQAEILRGGCEGTTSFVFTSFGETPRLPRVDPGVYGFYARAADASCFWYAAGCQEVTLPTDDPIEVQLTALSDERRSCDDMDCALSACTPPEVVADDLSDFCTAVGTSPIVAYDFAADAEASSLMAIDRAVATPDLALTPDPRDPIGLSFSPEAGLSLSGGRLEADLASSAALGGALSSSATQPDAVTVSLWITPSERSEQGPGRIVTYAAGPDDGGFLVGQFEDQVQVRVRTQLTPKSGALDPAGKRADLGVQVDIGVSTHIVFSYNEFSGELRLFKNGVFVAKRSHRVAGEPAQFAWNLAEARLALGDAFNVPSDQVDVRQWTGSVRQAAIYHTALSTKEISALYRAGRSTLCGE